MTNSSAAPADDEAATDLLEGLEGVGLEAQMVDAAPAEHRRLALGLGVPVDLEEVDLGLLADAHEGEHPLVAHPLLAEDLGLEHVAVEVDEPLGVLGDDGHVVHSVQQHGMPPLRRSRLAQT